MLKTFMLSWGLVILSAMCDSYAAFIVKLKLNEFSMGHLSSLNLIMAFIGKILGSPLLMSAVITFALAPFLWFSGLSRLNLSAAYPVNVSIHLLLIFLFSALFLGELLNAKKIAGALLLLVSSFLLFASNES